MKNVIYILVVTMASWAGMAYADEVPSTAYSATCNGRGFNLKPVTIQWDGSFSGPTTAQSDAGITTFKITDDNSGKVLLDLTSGKQKFFRQTEAGVSFFGIYNDGQLTDAKQTVYVFIAYNSITSIYEFMSKIKHGVDLSEALNGTEFMFQAFAEEDKESTLSLQFKCNFVVR